MTPPDEPARPDDKPASTEPEAPPAPDRRRFLKVATCAIGGGVGAAVIVPAARYLLHPVGERTVIAAAEPIDAVALDALGPVPVRVPLVAKTVRDAWSATADVPLGAAWVRRGADGKVHALSSVCPHLGCAIGFDRAKNQYVCPCHDSSFSATGDKLHGPSERGLDPLVTTVEGGRVKITWQRFRLGTPNREPA